MTPTEIVTITGVLLAVLFEYLPGLHTWYNALKDTEQRLIMLGLMVITVAATYGLSCAGWLHAWQCNQVGIKDAVFALGLAIAANQGTHRILPRNS